MPTYHPALTDLNWVHPAIEHELSYAVERALEAGAQAPLDYLGAGAYGIVFQDQEHRAFKVARHFRPGKLWLEQDFEWMAFARQVPDVAPHVVKPFAYDDERDVIIMEAINTRTELPSGG